MVFPLHCYANIRYIQPYELLLLLLNVIIFTKKTFSGWNEFWINKRNSDLGWAHFRHWQLFRNLFALFHKHLTRAYRHIHVLCSAEVQAEFHFYEYSLSDIICIIQIVWNFYLLVFAFRNSQKNSFILRFFFNVFFLSNYYPFLHHKVLIHWQKADLISIYFTFFSSSSF